MESAKKKPQIVGVQENPKNGCPEKIQRSRKKGCPEKER
jgi:hypothetical protein